MFSLAFYLSHVPPVNLAFDTREAAEEALGKVTDQGPIVIGDDYGREVSVMDVKSIAAILLTDGAKEQKLMAFMMVEQNKNQVKAQLMLNRDPEFRAAAIQLQGGSPIIQAAPSGRM